MEVPLDLDPARALDLAKTTTGKTKTLTELRKAFLEISDVGTFKVCGPSWKFWAGGRNTPARIILLCYQQQKPPLTSANWQRPLALDPLHLLHFTFNLWHKHLGR